MLNFELEQILNEKLASHRYHDYSPNGLQVQGKSEVKKIITGVSACQLLLEQAIAHQADAVIVHHGYFWRNEDPTVTGIKYHRLKALLSHDINLYGYHLPLDGHPELGNNSLLAQTLQIDMDERSDVTELLFTGSLVTPQSGEQFKQRLEHCLQRPVLHCGEGAPEVIKRIGWCSGAGQDFIEQATKRGVDAFFTGEVSERTIHIARESAVHFFAGGHHATERYGIRALGEWLARHYPLEVIFIDIDNPA